MAKKLLSLFTIVSLIIFHMSCALNQEVGLDEAIQRQQRLKKGLRVTGIIKKTGERVEFVEGDVTLLSKNGLQAKVIESTKETIIELSNFKEKLKTEDGRLFITTKDGKTYEYTSMRIEPKQLVLECGQYKTVFIPYQEISKVILERSDQRRIKTSKKMITILAIAATGTIVAAILVREALGNILEEVGSNVNCSITAMLMDTPLQSALPILRNFRDQYLMSSQFGRLFVAFYYQYSPKLAKMIGRSKLLKFVFQIHFLPFIAFC